MRLLNILICHTPGREEFLHRLLNILNPQVNNDVLVIIDDNPIANIGAKRNNLLSLANSKYIAFIDDDDRVSDNYIKLLMEGIEKDVDCCSLVGEITFDGINPKPFIHSIKYDRYWEDDKAYYRYPNHLNCVKSEIANKFKFPELNHGEDTAFATKMHRAGVLKTEHEISETIYYYDYRSNK
jgi:glycosyltransferase involved in cell wall biosynthesis